MGVPRSPIKSFFRKELLALKEICPADHFFHVSDELQAPKFTTGAILPCGRGQSIGWWWCSRPHVVAACPACLPACLPARAGSPRGPGARKEGRKLAAPAAAPWGVWDGEEVGDAAGLPVSTRVAPRYFL